MNEACLIDSLVQFGVAGLMGMLWVWERSHSRRRERQLSEAHDKLMRRDQQLAVLIRLVRQNTRAAVSLERTHKQMCELLQEMRREQQRSTHAA
jgi:hypothetical protein